MTGMITLANLLWIMKAILCSQNSIEHSNESISRAFMIIKRAMEDSFTYYNLNLEKTYLDELRIKVDNTNQRYLLSAFYYNQKRGNIEGLYFLAMDKNSWKPCLKSPLYLTKICGRKQEDNQI